MKFRVSVFLIIFTALLSAEASAKVYVAEPYLAQQPAYAGMTFYVYRPHGLPKGWYLTFDGYAVTQARGEVWVYGTMQSGELIRTSYVVGSVNPALIGLIPYAGANVMQLPAKTGIVNQPFIVSPNQPARQIYVPDWSFDPAFLSVSNWKSTVDRIGILHKHDFPVAWKGNRPAVIYVWTGKIWKQIDTRDERLSHVINLNLYGLLREKDRRQRWYAEDIQVLREKTIEWGYLWIGEVFATNY